MREICDIQKDTIKNQLKKYGNILLRIRGISMNPLLIEGRDAVFIEARQKDTSLNKWDVVLFEREKDKSLVLHRITDMVDGGYLILGDNCIEKEFVKDEAVIGVMTAIKRNGGGICPGTPQYTSYVKRRMKTYPLRKIFLRVKLQLAKKLHIKKDKWQNIE